MKAIKENGRLRQTFLTPAALRHLPFGLADVAVLLGAFGLLYLIARVGTGAMVRFQPPEVLPNVTLDAKYLPYYAARSTLRMFVALLFSMTVAKADRKRLRPDLKTRHVPNIRYCKSAFERKELFDRDR